MATSMATATTATVSAPARWATMRYLLGFTWVFVRALVHHPSSSRPIAGGALDGAAPPFHGTRSKKKAACGRPLTELTHLFIDMVITSKRTGVPHTGVYGTSLLGRSARAATALKALLLFLGGSPASDADHPAPLMGVRVMPSACPPRFRTAPLFRSPQPIGRRTGVVQKGHDATTPRALEQTGSTRVSRWALS
jgi:hypothetical protein